MFPSRSMLWHSLGTRLISAVLAHRRQRAALGIASRRLLLIATVHLMQFLNGLLLDNNWVCFATDAIGDRVMVGMTFSLVS
jgi:hypothetical protein